MSAPPIYFHQLTLGDIFVVVDREARAGDAREHTLQYQKITKGAARRFTGTIRVVSRADLVRFGARQSIRFRARPKPYRAPVLI